MTLCRRLGLSVLCVQPLSYLHRASSKGPRSYLQSAASQRLRSHSYCSTASSPKSEVQDPKPFSAIPGPLSLPVLGSSYKYLPLGEYRSKDTTINYRKLHKKYGDIVKEDVLPTLTLLHLYDPDDIEMVLRLEDKSKPPQRFTLEANKKYKDLRGLPYGISNEMSEKYYEQRSPVQKALLRPQAVAELTPFVSQVAEECIQYFRDVRGDDMKVSQTHEKLQKYGLEAMATILFGHGVGVLRNREDIEPDAREFLDNMYNLMQCEHELTLSYMNPFSKAKMEETDSFKKYVDVMDLVYKILGEEVKKIEMELQENDEDGKRSCLMKTMITDSKLPRNSAADAAATLFSGASDTASNSLTISLFILSKNPKAQEKLHQEVSDILKGETDITEEHLSSMKYLKAVVKETQRIKPITSGNARTTTKDMVIKGYHVPAGTCVYMHNEVVSNDEKYVRNSDQFLPERWLRGSDEDIHPFLTLPFGFGTRSCIGKRFALLEMYVLLAKISQNFRVEYYGPDLTYCTKIVTFPEFDPDFHFYDW